MNTLEMLEKRNQEFAAHQFTAGLTPLGTLKTMIISCVDARADPAHHTGSGAWGRYGNTHYWWSGHASDAADDQHAAVDRSESRHHDHHRASSYAMWNYAHGRQTRHVGRLLSNRPGRTGSQSDHRSQSCGCCRCRGAQGKPL